MSSDVEPSAKNDASVRRHATDAEGSGERPTAGRIAQRLSPHETHICKTCGHDHRGRYCNRCGQKARDGRLTTRRLIADAVREVSDISRRVVPTAVHLTFRPGTVLRCYWAGQTQRWAHPLKYFFFAFAILQIVAWQTGFFDGAAQAMIDQRVLKTSAAASFLRDGFTALFVILLPVLAGLGRIGSRYTLAEHLVFNAYVMGHLALAYTTSLAIRRGAAYVIGNVSLGGMQITLYVMIAFYIYAFADTMRQPRLMNTSSQRLTAWVWGFVRGTGVILLGLVACIMISGTLIGLIESFLQ